MNEVVYNEDLVKTVENKYLAVNVVSKRARQINAEGLPIVPSSVGNKKQKPVAIATQELIDGKLHYEQDEAQAPASEPAAALFTEPQESDDGSEIFGEEIVHAAEPDSEEEEPEEGI